MKFFLTSLKEFVY